MVGAAVGVGAAGGAMMTPRGTATIDEARKLLMMSDTELETTIGRRKPSAVDPLAPQQQGQQQQQSIRPAPAPRVHEPAISDFWPDDDHDITAEVKAAHRRMVAPTLTCGTSQQATATATATER